MDLIPQRHDWQATIFNEDKPPIRAGQRLGVPFVRSLQATVSIKLRDGSELLIAQDGSGQSAISGVVWDCGLLMADYLLHLSAHDELANVLDLGCGTGIGGMLALHLFEGQVTFSDRCLSAALQSNLAALPGPLQERALFVEHDWEQAVPAALADSWDMIICSDLLYDAKHHSSLLRLLGELSFQRAVFAYKKRHDKEEREFLQALSQTCRISVVDLTSLQLVNLPAECACELYLLIAQPLY